MNYDHMDFKEALKYLGDKVGINTSNVKIKKKDTKYDPMYEAYELS
jgi:DNA primase